MTALTDFSTEDRAVLARTPNALVMATAYSEQDGIFSIRKELKAGLQAAIDAATAFPDNQIIQQLAIDMNAIDQNEMDEVRRRASSATDPADRMEERNPAVSRPFALQLAEKSLAIMEANATEQETIEFKYWLYALADQVTLASKAGGFLGFGGTRVSRAEAAFLADLRQTLGIPEGNVPSAAESNAKLGDESEPESVTPGDDHDHDHDTNYIARMDAASVQPEAPSLTVSTERPEDV